VNTLNYLRSCSAPAGICLGVCLLWSRVAVAEVTLVEKDGWTFYADGRVGAFASLGFGDDFPLPTPNPENPTPHEVMGASGGEEVGTTDAGWPSSYQRDENNRYLAMRIRSGMLSNILGFGLKREVSETTTVKGYLSFWATVETPGRDKWMPVEPEAREGYFRVEGPWGSATVGRTFGFYGRTSAEIDFMYGHTYGLGLPCSDYVGPGCGHIGTGVAFPGYSAGIAYSSPSLGGLRLHAGIYDPIAFNRGWEHAPFLRPEGAVTFEAPLGDDGKLIVAAEGLFQPLARTETDDTTLEKREVTTSVWGVSGGGRLEVGPLRLGLSAFRGRGVGLSYAIQGSPETGSTFDAATHEIRMFTGFYGQLALMFGGLHLAAGGGAASVDQLPTDRNNFRLSVIQRQIGASAAAYYHLSDSVVVGLDYFRFMARWYGAPRSFVDPTTQTAVLGQGVLPGEKQDLNFVNAGVTFHW
jgi:hypothetical protein